MRTLTKLLLTTTVLGLAITASAAMELDEVIAKHIDARGGKDAWDAVQSMKLTGSYTAFSQVSDFTLLRKRDHRYLLDSLHNGKTVIVGYDDETLWWDNHWVQPGARPVAAEADVQALVRDIDFASPLFDYAERGFELELLGETEFDGMPAIGIKLTRPDESVETWYLDPETFLEFARESPGSDFGTPMPATTYFDDFREVGGIKVPHLRGNPVVHARSRDARRQGRVERRHRRRRVRHARAHRYGSAGGDGRRLVGQDLDPAAAPGAVAGVRAPGHGRDEDARCADRGSVDRQRRDGAVLDVVLRPLQGDLSFLRRSAVRPTTSTSSRAPSTTRVIWS